MTTFLQLHLLTSYPPACLNRDDLNRPKTAVMGGIPRLRISSQSLKRAWRTSESFREKLTGNIGIRSKELGQHVRDALLSGNSLHDLLQPNAPEARPDNKVPMEDAANWAWMIAAEYVDKKSKGSDENDAKSNVSRDTLKSEQIVFYSQAEIRALNQLVVELRAHGKAPTVERLKAIQIEDSGEAADLALFGRMLASSPKFNVEAACQVAHAVTVHRAAVEDDFFTAVDDLNTREEDAGSAHMGEQGFGAGLFYIYVCLNCDQLREQLGNDLAGRAIKALVEAAATVAPTGKQNSFASRACAYYALAEKGSRQPRALSLAFMKPVNEYDDGMLANAVGALETMRDNLDMVYYGAIETEETDPKTKEKKKIRRPKSPLLSRSFNALNGRGSLEELLTFAAG